jgi:hypothetical protein
MVLALMAAQPKPARLASVTVAAIRSGLVWNLIPARSSASKGAVICAWKPSLAGSCPLHSACRSAEAMAWMSASVSLLQRLANARGPWHAFYPQGLFRVWVRSDILRGLTLVSR